jgi:UDP-N-acetylglucosamine 4-epimerase
MGITGRGDGPTGTRDRRQQVVSVFDRRVAELRTDPKRWFVTGAAGFVGSHLTEALLRLGQEVVALDNFATGTRRNLELVAQRVGPETWRRFRFIEDDLRSFAACRQGCDGADYVLHQGALGSVPRSIEYPLDTHTTNVDGTLNVFLAAVERGVSSVVYASSSSVYGDEPNLPKIESRIGQPLSPYAASKRMGEIYAGVLARTHGLRAIGLRYFNVVGTRQDPNGPYAAVVPRWALALSRGERAVIFGDGETSRDFCPVANVVQANLLAAMADRPIAGRVYNVALGGRTTLNQLYVLLRDGLAQRGCGCAGLEPEYQDFRPGDVRHSLASTAAARDDLGYEPFCTLMTGLQEVMDYFASPEPSS